MSCLPCKAERIRTRYAEWVRFNQQALLDAQREWDCHTMQWRKDRERRVASARERAQDAVEAARVAGGFAPKRFDYATELFDYVRVRADGMIADGHPGHPFGDRP